MFPTVRSIASLLAIGILTASLTACEKKEVVTEEKGPAEKAGQQLDQAASRAREEINKFADKAGKGLQEMGRKIQDEAQQAQDDQKKD